MEEFSSAALFLSAEGAESDTILQSVDVTIVPWCASLGYGLQGMPGIVIASSPASNSGRTTWFLNLVRSVRPQSAMRSAIEYGIIEFLST
jgi:hypothetical protein